MKNKSNFIAVVLTISILLGKASNVFGQTGSDILYFADSISNNALDAAKLKRDYVPFQANIRSYSLYQGFQNGTKREAHTIGGSLSWNPEIIKNHIRGGVTLATSQKIHAPEGRDGTLLLQEGQKSYAVLSEYYLNANVDKWSMNLGAMEYNNPLFNSADIRMTPITHRGLNINYRFRDNNYLGIAVIDAIKWLNGTTLERLYEYAGINEEHLVWAIGGKRKTENYSYGIYSLMAPQYYFSVYAEAYRKFSINTTNITLNAQFMAENSIGRELGGDFDFYMLGAKLDLDFGKFTSVMGYTYVPSKNSAQQVWGIMPYYNIMIFSFFNRPKEHALRLGILYPINNKFKIISNVASGFTPSNGNFATPNAQEYNLTLEYTLNSLLNFRFRGAFYDQHDSGIGNNANDVTDFRIIINYYWK